MNSYKDYGLSDEDYNKLVEDAKNEYLKSS